MNDQMKRIYAIQKLLMVQQYTLQTLRDLASKLFFSMLIFIVINNNITHKNICAKHWDNNNKCMVLRNRQSLIAAVWKERTKNTELIL